jgi:plastocyanin
MTRSILIRWTSLLLFAAPLALSGCGSRLPSDPEANMAAVIDLRHTYENAGGKKPATAEAKSGGPELKRVEGWASLKGRFVLDGPPPIMNKIDINNKDPEVCGVHPLLDESVVVGKDNGLANVAIFVRTPKIPVHKQYDASAADSIVIDNHDCRFEPHVQKVRIGQTLVVKNDDPVGHNTKADGRNLLFNASIAAKASYDVKVQAPESTPVPVSCSIHPWMRGKVVVTGNPYCAISKDDGSFEIENLPAGELEIQIWQENAGGGLPVTAPKLKPGSTQGRYIVSLDPNQTVDLGDITVAAAAVSGK